MAGGVDPTSARFAIVRELSSPAAPHLVSLARDASGEAVVLKRLRGSHRDREDLALRLGGEAEILARVGGSRGVVRLVAVEDEPLTLAMEYIGGGSLSDRLHDAESVGITIPVSRALCVAGGMLDALAHVHAHGVVHRDVKPSNLLFAGDGTVRVIDFGVAARADPARGGACYGLPADWIEDRVGTLPYAAPESVLEAGSPAEPACDVYAVGVVLYEMLTGAPPWRPADGESAKGFARRVVRAGDAAVASAAAQLPPALRHPVAAAMHPDPSCRPSASELAAALKC